MSTGPWWLLASLEAGGDCAEVLVQIASVRGAVHGLMMEVLNAHLLEHVVSEADQEKRTREVEIVADLMRTYVK
jgi:FrmR/RcnR family transcriptional regulator, repressor of rcnA expression